ncbi:MAG: VOC family protein [Candidatus Margulisbacteria bacterium]|nr:VOC family protein [Candidatus Margulisiibacteriota bacterium]
MNINFFTLYLSAIEPSLTFYRDTLGLRVVRDFSPASFLRIVFLQGEGAGQIELIENKKQPAAEGHNCCSHVSIGIQVADIEAIYKKMQDRQVKITREFLQPERGPKMFFIEDPNGIEIEFIQ